MDHLAAKQTLLGIENVLARETFMIIVSDLRNESTREIIKVTRDVTEATPVISGVRTYRIGTASWLDQASCIEADQVTSVANSTAAEEIVDR